MFIVSFVMDIRDFSFHCAWN